jgi:hypothetical protein
MNVFRHDDVAYDYEPVTSANAVQNLQEEITEAFVSEKRLAAVTTESQKVQVVTAIKSVETFGHVVKNRENSEDLSVTSEHSRRIAGVRILGLGIPCPGIPGLAKPARPGAPHLRHPTSGPHFQEKIRPGLFGSGPDR